jgi:hypothetical protein
MTAKMSGNTPNTKNNNHAAEIHHGEYLAVALCHRSVHFSASPSATER